MSLVEQQLMLKDLEGLKEYFEMAFCDKLCLDLQLFAKYGFVEELKNSWRILVTSVVS